MKKIYNYGNCIIELVISNTSSDVLRTPTETFLRKVLKERIQNGNSNKSGNINKK